MNKNDENSINETSYKHPDKTIKFNIKQDEKYKNVFAWEASAVISNVNSVYYKVELMDAIIQAISEGINPEDIIIFSKRTNYSYAKTDLSPFALYKNLKKIYDFGDPISLIPNENILFLNLFTSNMRELNKIFSNNDIDYTITKHIDQKYRNYRDNIDHFIENTHNNIQHHVKEYKYIKSEINYRLNKFKTDYHKLTRDFQTIKHFKNILINAYHEYDVSKIKNHKYFKSFFNKIKQSHQPLVGYIKNNTFYFLGTHHLTKSKINSLTFKLRSATSNSPFDYVFEAGISAIRSVIEAFFDYEIHKTDLETAKANLKTAQYALKKEKIETEILEHKKLVLIINELTDILSTIDKMKKQTSSFQYGEYIIDMHKDLLRSILNKHNKFLKENGLNLNSIDIIT